MKSSLQLKTIRASIQALPAPAILAALGVALLAAIFLGVSFGSTAIPVGSIAQILLNATGLFHFARRWDPGDELIILQLRLPVVIGAGLVGMALSVAGVLFQGMLRNPLADPYLIGTSSGAALGAAIAFILPYDTIYGTYFPLTPVLAFAGALLLAGILDAFGLGEESASYLGLRVERYKLLIIAAGALITAAAVSISGLIGFVGLVVPHTMRLLLGPRHRLLLPASALAGAIFLILADLLARVVIAPAVLPVGVFTALVGAPFFLFLLRNSKRTYRW